VVNNKFDRCPLEQFQAAIDYARGFARERAVFVNKFLHAEGWTQDSRVPDLKAGRVMNAASGAPLLAPGELVFVEASLPLTQVERAAAWPLPSEIAGIWATISGVRAPMILASPTGAWIQVPAELPCGPAWITLSNPSGVSHIMAVEIRPAVPGIFVVTHADGVTLDGSSPGRAGEVIVVWATGLGHAAIDPASGQPAPLDRLVATKNAVAATMDAHELPVLWAGLAPGYAGLYQVVVQLPQEPVGSAASMLTLTMFGEPGVAVKLPVQ
jgi:uncharacterized protein (TIGR03437 family)